MTELEDEPVEIVPYDPHWPNEYEEERNRILSQTGDLFAGLEHIGSTAVPGLAAKPIIDIMGGLYSLADSPRWVEDIVGLGYEHVPEFEDSFPDRRYFRTWDENGRSSRHLHVVILGSEWWSLRIQFREALRSDAAIREEYEQLKRRLARDYRNDRKSYTEGKAEFIAEVLARGHLLP